MQEYIDTTADFIRNYSTEICFAWTAALLLIYGDKLGQFAKTIARAWHFVFRVLFFLIVCGFGYGFLTVYIATFLKKKLLTLSDPWLIITITLAFFTIGILAEKKRHI